MTARLYSDKEIIAALEAAGGIVTHAAQVLGGADRKNIARRISRSETLKAKLAECREVNIDFAETKLMELIAKGVPSATIFYLKCMGKERGYVERVEQTGKDGKDLLLPVIAPPRASSMEEWLEQNRKEAAAQN